MTSATPITAHEIEVLEEIMLDAHRG